MNRLEKKCFIASSGLHLLLALVLLVGPAFLSPQPKPVQASQYLDIIPLKVIEAAFVGGGNPNAKPPAPSPSRPPQPPEDKPPKPNPVEPKPQTASVEPSDTKTRKPDIDLNKRVTRNSDSKSKSKPKETSESQKLVQLRSERAAAVRDALENLKDGLSSSTTIEIKGPGGEAYASYQSVLQSIYQMHYDKELASAGDLASKETTVVVSVTVARSGQVVNSRIIKPCGIAGFDRLVRRVLEQVDFIRPFPEGVKDSERTFTVGFELRPNRAIG